jgi:predicted metal-dependent peptidase
MPYFRRKYYYHKENIPIGYRNLEAGYSLISGNPLFGKLGGDIIPKSSHLSGKGSMACVSKTGNINVNSSAKLNAEEWSYVLAHNLLHLAFGHFDSDKIPDDIPFIPALWNKACDLYIAQFLKDIAFGESVIPDPAAEYKIKLNDEQKIYAYLFEHEALTGNDIIVNHPYGTNSDDAVDMIGIDHPLIYRPGESNTFSETFSYAITHSIKSAVSEVGGHNWTKEKDTVVSRAASWFLSHYPLLGGLAASFKIIEDLDLCRKNEIHIAAVDAEHGEIYANPVCGLSEEEWKFVLAHEYLHAGLCHHRRCMGRDRYLWNVACDYVINDWLHEMQIGIMPSDGLLYDETLHGMSAEAIYDLIVKELRKFKKLDTFRGYGKGDIFSDSSPHFEGMGKGITLDDFFKSALREGLDYHVMKERGLLPAGLIEEIRALSMPPIPWEVELAEWFDVQFPPLEKYRTYARPSRRQGSTPDIPRPSYALRESDLANRTFGVVIDTSGSMETKQIGLALGAIASYAVAKEVPFVRIIFCDAEATDAGYMAPEEIAGRVEVTGRGGTILQPGIYALEKATDFPPDGPILVITDGYIEPDLKIKREHAFLIPHGNRLPFTPRGKVFYMKNLISETSCVFGFV